MTTALQHSTTPAPPAGRRQRYPLFGIVAASDFALPARALATGAPDEVDVIFRDAGELADAPLPARYATHDERCHCALHQGQVVSRIAHGARETVIWATATATSRIDAAGRVVDVYADRDGSAALDVGLHLAGLVSSFVLYRQQRLCLHASAAVVDGGAVAFLGPRGRGKSTFAAGLLTAGFPLLTDDTLPLAGRDGGWAALPGMPAMKLWRRSVDGVLGAGLRLPRILDGVDKHLLRLDDAAAFASGPAPLRAIYLLDRYDADGDDAPIRIAPVPRRDALMALLLQSPLRPYVPASELLATLAPLAAGVPVRALVYPSGFERQPAVRARLLADLEALS